MSQLKGSWHPNLVTLVIIKDSLCNYPKRQRKITLYRDLSGQNKTSVACFSRSSYLSTDLTNSFDFVAWALDTFINNWKSRNKIHRICSFKTLTVNLPRVSVEEHTKLHKKNFILTRCVRTRLLKWFRTQQHSIVRMTYFDSLCLFPGKKVSVSIGGWKAQPW